MIVLQSDWSDLRVEEAYGRSVQEDGTVLSAVFQGTPALLIRSLSKCRSRSIVIVLQSHWSDLRGGEASGRSVQKCIRRTVDGILMNNS